jgi:arylsulfatase A-like enzyme
MNSSLRNFLVGITVCLSVAVLGKPHPKPNILIIVCDDLNDAIEGMGGHPQAKTPYIDRLAKRGVRFTNAASNCPLCGPSRASMWSGLYPHTTGYYGFNQHANRWKNNPEFKPILESFRERLKSTI